MFAASESDAAAATAALRSALGAELRELRVRDGALPALPSVCVALLRRRHGVRLWIRDRTATVCGFRDFCVAAVRELRETLREMRGDGRAVRGEVG